MRQSTKLDGITLPKNSQVLIKQLKSGFDLSSFIEFHNAGVQNAEPHLSNPELYGYIGDYCDSGEEESWDLRSATAIINMATHITNVTGFDLIGLNGSASITKYEQNIIIKMLVDMNPRATADQLRKQINVTNYTFGHILMLLSKEIRNMKIFYFKNNSETQFLELQRLENALIDKDLEVEHLRTRLSEAETQCERQREEIKLLTDELFKENKDAVKPYVSEISALNGRVRELEKALEAEQAKIPELNALREFAFAAQTEYIPKETTVTLAELIRDRKIIVIGGHVNWRNKMKERYCTIEFLDGHSVSLNNAIFDRADFTLLYTCNMSHKLYDKIIDHLRRKKLRFDYLGRSLNQELLEAEMVSILQRKVS